MLYPTFSLSDPERSPTLRFPGPLQGNSVRFVNGAVFLGPLKVGRWRRCFETVGWVERSENHHRSRRQRWVSLRSTHPTRSHDQLAVRSNPDRRSVIGGSGGDGNVVVAIPVLFSDDPCRWVDDEEKTR